jgi:primosomal protein N' (replication factor Y)
VYALYADLALNRPLREALTYGVPAELESRIAVGMRALVPLGGAREVGVIVGLRRETAIEPRKLRAVSRLLDAEPLLDADLLGLARWTAERWACSWGEALAALLPAPLKRERRGRRVVVAQALPAATPEALATLAGLHEKQHRLLRTLLDAGGRMELRDLLRRVRLSDVPAKTLAKAGLIELERVELSGDALVDAPASQRPRPERLSDDQGAALAAIAAALATSAPRTFLLHGVTGSGKTEVYLGAIESALALGRGAIVLVPEIALTPQTVGWFRARFERVAVLHSRMTDGERLATWLAVRRGAARVVVGARSAVFAPVRRLGVIVVDEEHEPSFKQASVPRYHARDVAVERARQAGAVCILGSATPTLETLLASRRGEIAALALSARVGGGSLPAVEVVDLRLERLDGEGQGLFSNRLRAALGSALARREQAILFINRRGYAPVLWCLGCRETVRCSRCDMALAWHRRIRRLVCHGCCEERAMPGACPTCSLPSPRLLGSGSERVEAAVQALWPAARVRRMDSDTMLRREHYEEALGAFGRGEIDVLVGTQMIAKGLDFPRVTVVGVVAADSGLHLPDFRAAERTFQLLSQVAGRAGRAELAGRIVIQTHAPSHPAIERAAAHDYRGFADGELALREELRYPPFSRLVRALAEDEDEARASAAAADCARELRAALAGADADVLGPAPAPIAQLRGRHRWHALVKAGTEQALARARELLLELAARSSRPKLAIDVDPVGLL